VGTLSPDDVLDAAIRINADCRENGTRFRLRELLEKELDTLLPNNADEIISDRSGAVGVGLLKVVGWDEGQVGLLQPECAQEFRSREDLIECILASCNLPFWFDRWPLLRTERGLCTDGFFSTPVTQFGCIATGARRDVAICPFPASTVSPRLETFEGDNDLIQPGRFPNEHADQFTMQQMVTIALAQPPASDATLRALFRAGEADARAWHEREMDRR